MAMPITALGAPMAATPESPEKEYCSTSEAAQRLGLSLGTVQQMVENGQLEGWKTVGGHRRIRVSSIEEFRARSMAGGGHAPVRPAASSLQVLVAEDDPKRADFEALAAAGLAKITWVEKTGCEGIADFLYEYVNEIFLPSYGTEEAARLWCSRVEVRETAANMAYRQGHREDGEFA